MINIYRDRHIDKSRKLLIHKDAMETNLLSLNLSSQRTAAHFAYTLCGRCSEYFQPLEAAPSAAISRKWAESAILSDLLYLIVVVVVVVIVIVVVVSK